MIQLGKLEKVELRSIWPNEALHFTPWLAHDTNITLLSEAVGIELQLISTEERVGIFRADIVCQDIDNDKTVLIENQFGNTDHKHLGQLLTYSSAVDAVTIIWIAEHFTEEHRSVLDWLNNTTDETVDFFGVEIEVYRIGNSTPAPKFNIVSKPNNWSRTIKQAARTADFSVMKLRHVEYWEGLKKLLDNEPAEYKIFEASSAYYQVIRFGRTDDRIRVYLSTRGKLIGIIFIIRDENADERFNALREKYEVETKRIFGEETNWEFQQGRSKQNIIFNFHNCDPLNKNDWPRQHELLKENVRRIYEHFKDKI